MSTTTVTILATGTTDTLPGTTAAFGVAAFERRYRAAHGQGCEVPCEVHTASLWAGPDSVEAHANLVETLADESSALEDVGADGYVLLEGQGDGCDVWARYTKA